MKKLISILLVGVDLIAADLEFQEAALQRAFTDPLIELCATERQFRERLSHINTSPPDLVFMSVRFVWDYPSEDPPPPAPPDVAEQGYTRRAGFRGVELLNAKEPTIPVIVHSAFTAKELEKEIVKLPPNSCYIQDGDDIGEAAQQIRSACERLLATG